ncbi:hypothetical protein HYDPIDRAFT_28419 [Hydnomerulius pinastri MD-312]|uniref:Cullin N-terminal domain-containing protein n=1 Tax=Hydnomerulius pinastri MD-312 TaxID=994086 RepID=A0A0C9W9M0_9AGAM|nr:hypothetical protein HYDPIDRAFT_28419 [Hydnomerulius pinastri MD-312]
MTSSRPTANLEAVSKGFDVLLALPKPEPVPNLPRSPLYSAIYNSFDGPRRSVNDEVANEIYGTLSGKLDAHLQRILNGATQLEGVALLEYYSAQWTCYSSLAEALTQVCSYLTRPWLRVTSQYRTDVYPVDILALTRWKALFVDGLQEPDQKLTKALLSLIASHTENPTASSNLLKPVLSSLVSLGYSRETTDPIFVDSSHWRYRPRLREIETVNLDIYKDVFERPFLIESGMRFRERAKVLISGPLGGYARDKIMDGWVGGIDRLAGVFPSEETRYELLKIPRRVVVWR